MTRIIIIILIFFILLFYFLKNILMNQGIVQECM